jgi:hypothetical protein
MMTSLIVFIGLAYWILAWYNFALWIDLFAYDMPLEGYMLRRFGFDMTIAGWYWTAMYIVALVLS